MFDYSDYKRKITSYAPLYLKKVVKDSADSHIMSGIMAVGHCDIKVLIECRNYGNYAAMSIGFGMTEKNFDFLDKEFQAAQMMLFNALRPYNATNNGLFLTGGIWITDDYLWGVQFNDLSAIDPVNIRTSDDAMRVVGIAMSRITQGDIAPAISALGEFFVNKKINIKH